MLDVAVGPSLALSKKTLLSLFSHEETSFRAVTQPAYSWNWGAGTAISVGLTS